MGAVSLDQHGAVTSRGPTADEALRSALGSVRAEGLEPDAFGVALVRAVDAGEITSGEAIERALAFYAA